MLDKILHAAHRLIVRLLSRPFPVAAKPACGRSYHAFLLKRGLAGRTAKPTH